MNPLMRNNSKMHDRLALYILHDLTTYLAMTNQEVDSDLTVKVADAKPYQTFTYCCLQKCSEQMSLY